MTFSFRSQFLYPAFFTTTECSPAATLITEGVLPTKAPSTSMSALAGVEETEILLSDEASDLSVVATGCAAGDGAEAFAARAG